MAASFQCFTFFSRKRPASTASKTNFCSKLQASVGFSHIYQRVCLFTAILSKKKIRKSFVIEAKIYCLHAFEQWTHSHGFNCTSHSRRCLKVNKILIMGQAEILTASSSTFSKCLPAVGALARKREKTAAL